MSYRWISLLAGLPLLLSASGPGYYRSPDINQNTLVFTAEGDIWKASASGQNAQRLTSSPQEELDASLSPDGQWVAFTANYEGADEAYVMPINGGVAKRVSFESSRVKVLGWAPNGELLVASNSQTGPIVSWVLKLIDVNELTSQVLPLSDASTGVVSSDGKTLFFTRFGLHTFSDNAKIYRGGLVAEVWQWELGSKKEAKRLLADHKGDVRDLSFANGHLYFTSDATGNRNLWQLDLKTNEAKAITQHKNWQVRDPVVFGDVAVYQKGADLVKLELTSGESQILPIELTSDFPYLRERWVNQPLNYLTHADVSSGERVALTARGRIALASTDNSRLIQVATDPRSRSRNAVSSPDGKWVYALNDASGELEIWRFASDGSDQGKQLTDDGGHFRYNLYPSPDGRYLAHDDSQGMLWLLDLKTGKNSKILSGFEGSQPFATVTWSADSQWLAFSHVQTGDMRNRVGIYSLASKRSKLLTTDKYVSFSPVFSTQGDWLYFLSSREFNATPSSPWGDRNMGPMFDKRAQIFAYPLVKQAQFAFADKTELSVVESKEEDDDKKSNEALAWKELGDALWQVPVASDNFNSLVATDSHLFVLASTAGNNDGATLKAIKFEPKPEAKSVTEKVRGFGLSLDRKKMLVQKGRGAGTQFYVLQPSDSFPSDLKDNTLKTGAWKFAFLPRQEWQQIFHDAWLMHREFLYDPDMRGLDWAKVKERYHPLLSRLTDRHELNDVFKQMMGELNALHSQVRGGDTPKDSQQPTTANLGAALEQQSSGVVIKHIYQTEPERPATASPLALPGVNAQNGDRIVSINGIAVNTIADVTQALRNQVGQQVLLSLKRGKQSIETVVKPVDRWAEYNLRYADWTQTNLEKVATSAPSVGYFHLAAMGSNDIENFAREFYANIDKKGLIIDVRNNRGGNIDSWLIEKLLRRTWAFWDGKNFSPFTNMQQTFRGHIVVLINQSTYSDGETFSAAVKALDIAPLIGKRTAGAGVWLSDVSRQSDNGMARVAQFAQYAINGDWILEGHGVSPDIEVHNLPYASFKGEDAQLEYAIKYLNEKIKSEPIPELKAKAFTPYGEPAKDIE